MNANDLDGAPETRLTPWMAARHTLAIRVIVVTSLALLAAGATSPLLTTERFYFFSNTFSLISGMRQLVDNDQILIAAVIALFSLGVPLVKSGVIWFAAAQYQQRTTLLAVADRFGKWSMLEVFVAALLIVSLKLGPVVDATLHYGAYLLAASVLLAGLASQLLAPAPAGKPLFSSPATLTIGAIGGAVAATLLIALLNPGLLSLDGIVGTPQARCITRVLQTDQAYAAAGTDEAGYAADLKAIDSRGCPDDFREAFAEYVEAWQALVALDTDTDREPSLLDRAIGRLGLAATRADRIEEIATAWNELARLAEEHGVTAPAK